MGTKAGRSQQLQRVLDEIPPPPPPQQTKEKAKDSEAEATEKQKLRRAAVQLGMAAIREHEWDAKAKFTDQELVDLSHIKEIILDTGAGVCLVGRGSLMGVTEDQFLKIHPPLNLTTANGSVKAAHEIRAKVSQLSEPISFVVLDKSPTVIALGLLCEDGGWTFAWEGFQRP